MPIELLKQLAASSLPLEIRGEEVEKVIVLRGEQLIAAKIVSPETSAAGLPTYHATVYQVTPAGYRLTRRRAEHLEHDGDLLG